MNNNMEINLSKLQSNQFQHELSKLSATSDQQARKFYESEQFFGGNNSSDNSDKVKATIRSCTYPQNIKFTIQKAVRQVLQVYPMFAIDTISFLEGGKQVKYVELKGFIEIDAHGKHYKISYNIMLPGHFPTNPPFVRIINTVKDGSIVADEFYKSVRSEKDYSSYILNTMLQEIKYWDPTKSLVNVVIESYDLMRNKPPFVKVQQNQWSNGWQNGQHQQPNSMYSTQQTNHNWNSNGWVNGKVPNTNTNTNTSSSTSIGNKNIVPPIPFNPKQNVADAVAKSQNYVTKTKEQLNKLNAPLEKALKNIQQMGVIAISLKSEETVLREKNIEMLQFLNSNEMNESSKMTNLIMPADEKSEQILELSSSIKAREECLCLLESKMNEDKISFEQFLKHARKIEEIKFEERYLLAKCLQNN